MNEEVADAPQTEADFLRAVQVPTVDEPVVLAIRRVLGEWCGVPTECVRADARPSDLSNRMRAGWSQGWDEAGFLMKLEDNLGVTIDTHIRLPALIGTRFLFWKSDGADSIANWIKEVATILRGKLKT
jgi:hypothetical protein